jgi:hypothetical protein
VIDGKSNVLTVNDHETIFTGCDTKIIIIKATREYPSNITEHPRPSKLVIVKARADQDNPEMAHVKKSVKLQSKWTHEGCLQNTFVLG